MLEQLRLRAMIARETGTREFAGAPASHSTGQVAPSPMLCTLINRLNKEPLMSEFIGLEIDLKHPLLPDYESRSTASRKNESFSPGSGCASICSRKLASSTPTDAIPLRLRPFPTTLLSDCPAPGLMDRENPPLFMEPISFKLAFNPERHT